MASSKSTATFFLIVIAVIVVSMAAGAFLNTPEHRTPGQKISDAAGKLDEGVDNAARELKDRTPAEKMRDAVNDAKD